MNLKDYYSKEFVKDLAKIVKKEYRTFNELAFVKAVIGKGWEQRELKDRVRHISVCLREFLATDYLIAIPIIVKIAPNFTGMMGWICPDFIEAFGQGHYKESIKALKAVTEYFSSEFAIRPFIKMEPEQTMKTLLQWSKDKNYHVRRLASEGCRPRLPWGMALQNFKKDPAPIFPILDNLKNDSELYVRRSVANNLNDITKDNPELVLKWAKKNIGQNENIDWVIKHSLRGLLKAGNPEALKIFGYKKNENLIGRSFKFSKAKFKKGSSAEFSFVLENKSSKKTKVRLEYVYYYVRKTGTLGRKVFKVTEQTFESGRFKFNKKQSLKDMTVRKCYTGKHYISLLINGHETVKKSFQVI